MTRGARAAALAALALLLGGSAAADVHEREAALRRGVGPLVPVLVAAVPIPRGALITRARMAVRRVPARFAPRGAFRAAAEVEGARAGVTIPRGADLGPALLAGPQAAATGPVPLAPGERIARLVAVGSAAELRAGTHADVLATSGTRTRVLLAGAPVVEAREADGSEGPDAGLPHVLVALRVRLREAVLLTEAQAGAAELRVLARP